ncbi:hypothetical protein [Campylobacter jejuni]|uniref:hypothetical protein n=2 Tax=Campylobacter jejuni TaxID=197 RepID=UPI0005D97266|nr:hypothetical protein [Campylobacter jejuni]QOQ94513.1 hypothetical protein IMC74_00830 [Campylobacter jejuni subsp. jejuni]QOQ94521.1 hypothetical protein IMC74_00890 [Campylobacter jejuni subsp. jejuni]CKG87598.1 methyltransferase small [Campylobacter jejuni]CKG87885.1 methyltransferase small [Campylobacter jejuni]
MAKKRTILIPRIEDINITPDTSCMHPILEDNTLVCLHGGRVKLKAKKAKRIKSDNVPIMLDNEIQGASISGCLNPPILGGPCTKVAMVFAYTYSDHKVNNKHSVLQMGLIGMSIKGYPIFAIPKKNKIKFALAKIQASPLAKIKYDRIRWEGMGGKRNKKNKNDKARQIQALKNNRQKGNYTEMQMDKYYKAKGYKRISLNKVQGLDDKIHHGIDGIYYNPNKNPKYIIAEAKFRTSKLDIKTKQMSDEWITEKSRNRLGIVDEKHRKEIKELLKKNSNEVRKDLFHVDKKGNVSIKELDKNAKTKNLIERIENGKRY